MEPTTMNTTTEQSIVEAATANTTNDIAMKDTIQQNANNNMALADITTNAVNNAVVATSGDKVIEGGKPTIAEPEKSNKLKRERDTSEDDSENVTDDSTKRMKTFDVAGTVKDLDFVNAPSQPIVFGFRRAAVCESLPYYNAYNSSLYTQNGVARGIFLDKEARNHDVFKAEVLITTIGGGRVRDEDTKGMTRVNDQSNNTSTFRAFQSAKKDRAMIPVIVGRNHPHWPSPAPYPFCVLDYFMLTDIWPELAIMKPGAPAVRVWCVRLQKVDLNTVSWWDHNPLNYTHGAPASGQTCGVCHQESKVILQVGWTCLNHECGFFFKDSKGNTITSLAYSNAFLHERQQFIGPIPNLKPDPLTPEQINAVGLTGSESLFRDGIVCPSCGCCSSRRFWSRWTCENTACTFEMTTPMSPYPKAMIDAEVEGFDKNVLRLRKALHKASGVTHDCIATKLDTAAIQYRSLSQGLYQVSQFLLPDPEGKVIGSVTVLRATPVICERGPDTMFDELSTTDIGLSRNVVSARGSMVESLTRHFGQNWGAKYEFGVIVQSKGFSEAPDAILQAVQRLKWAGRAAVSMAAEFIDSIGLDGADIHDANVDFNECLSLGYMQDDRISYHDDGEKQLGPTVATLSLGSPAMMSFRPKKKSGMAAVVSEATRPKGTGKEYSEVLSFPLYHGDMLVMHGTAIHGFYDHKVEPSGKRRFALTCRYIEPSKLKTDEDRREALIKGTMPAHADKFIYTGDYDFVAQQNTIVEQVTTVQQATTTQHDVTVQESNIQNDYIQHQTLQQSTIDRYNFRHRKSGMTYKDEEAFPAL